MTSENLKSFLDGKYLVHKWDENAEVWWMQKCNWQETFVQVESEVCEMMS